MIQGGRKNRRKAGACGAVLVALLTSGAGAALAQTAPTSLPQTIAAPAAVGQVGPGAGIATPAPQDRGAEPLILSGPDGGQACDGFDWSKVPPPRVLPRPGFFTIPPTGPGYYSALDWLLGKEAENRPPQPYGPVSIMLFPLYDSDFKYLDKPGAEYQAPSDALKRMHLGDNFLLSIGGEERLRFLNEVDSRLSTRDNNYQLLRSRVYGDLWYQDKLRVYVEFIDSQIFNNNLPPLITDRNFGDLLNAFVDVKLMELGDAPVYFRGGRQELCYGSQRLISPLDWANDRRTFQGAKVFRRSEDFDADLFWVQPVIPNASRFDSVDDKQNFSGAWFTYRPTKSSAIDAYYLNLDNAAHLAAGEANARGVRAMGAFNTSTFGARYSGDYNKGLMWDFEGMYQFGPWSNQNTSATAYTTALGYALSDVPMAPQFWLSWDYASGDHNPGRTDTHGTFNQLFPFGHYYNFLDVVGRQNIEDLQAQFVFYPTKWITAGVQYHIFNLDSAKDALYNSAGAPIRVDPTGKAGTFVGDELDLIVNFHLTARQDLFLGYSKLYQGSFIRDTNVIGTKKNGAGSPEYIYAQYSFRW